MRALLRWAVAGALALASLTAPLPAAAQEGIGFWTAAAGGGGGGNVSQTEEWVGFNDGTGTTFNAGSGSKTVASFGITTANDWAGFCIYISSVNTNGNRYLLDVMDSPSHVIAANLFVAPGLSTNGAATQICIPLNVTAGKDINIGLQSAGAGNNLKVAIKGLVRQASSPPLWNTLVALNPDTSGIRASTVNVGNSLTLASPSWATLATTTAAYGALLYIIGEDTAGPGAGYVATAQIAVTPSGGSLGEISRRQFQTSGSGVLYRDPVGLIMQAIPNNAVISGAVTTSYTGSTDHHRIGLYALN